MENRFKMDDLGVALFLDNTQVALMVIFIHHCLLIQLMVNWWCGAFGGLDSDWIPGKERDWDSKVTQAIYHYPSLPNTVREDRCQRNPKTPPEAKGL